MGLSALQLAARLKLAQMWNHNGTNMDGIGFMYRSYRVLMELQGDTPHGTHLLPEKAALEIVSTKQQTALECAINHSMRIINCLLACCIIACLLLWQETYQAIKKQGRWGLRAFNAWLQSS